MNSWIEGEWKDFFKTQQFIHKKLFSISQFKRNRHKF